MTAYVITEDEILALIERIEPAVDRVAKADLHYTAGRLNSAKNKLIHLIDDTGRRFELP